MREYRSSREIDLAIIWALIKNPDGIQKTRLMRQVGANRKMLRSYLSRLQQRELIEIKERKRNAPAGLGNGLLSNNPKIVVHCIIKATEAGRLFFKNKKSCQAS